MKSKLITALVTPFNCNKEIDEEKVELTKKYGVKQAPTLVVINDSGVENIVNLSNIKKYIETL